MNTHGPLADALLRSGVVDAASLARALEAHASRPSTATMLQDVEFRTGKKATPVVVTERWLDRALEVDASAGGGS